MWKAIGGPPKRLLRRMEQEIAADPGCTPAALGRTLGWPRARVEACLERLAKDGVISQQRAGGARHLFALEVAPPLPSLRQLLILKNPENVVLHRWLANTTEPIQKAIVDAADGAFGLSKRTTQRRLRLLEEAGLLERYKRFSAARWTHYRALEADDIAISILQKAPAEESLPENLPAASLQASDDKIL